MLTQRCIMSPMSSSMPKTHPNSHTTIQSIVLLLIPLLSQIYPFIHLFLHKFIRFFSYAWNTPKLPHTRASMCTHRRKWYEWREAIITKITLRRPVWKLSGTVLRSVLVFWGYTGAWQTEQGTSFRDRAEMEEGTLPLELSFLEFR